MNFVLLLFDIFHKFGFSFNENFYTRGTTALTHSWDCTKHYGKYSTECVCVFVDMKIFSLQLAIFWLENRNENWMKFTILYFWIKLGDVRVNSFCCSFLLWMFQRVLGCKTDIRWWVYVRKRNMIAIGRTCFFNYGSQLDEIEKYFLIKEFEILEKLNMCGRQISFFHWFNWFLAW